MRLKKLLMGTLFLALFVLAGCVPPPTPVPTPTATPAPVTPLVISEVQTGATGNNNLEFIELYNATAEPLDLAGYQLVYRLAASREDMPVYAWTESTLVPAHGHYLLVRVGQEVGVVPDAEFDQPINTKGGGLALLDPDGDVVDSVGWGNAPEVFTEGSPAPVPENDTSIERLPGGEDGLCEGNHNNAQACAEGEKTATANRVFHKSSGGRYPAYRKILYPFSSGLPSARVRAPAACYTVCPCFQRARPC